MICLPRLKTRTMNSLAQTVGSTSLSLGIQLSFAVTCVFHIFVITNTHESFSPTIQPPPSPPKSRPASSRSPRYVQSRLCPPVTRLTSFQLWIKLYPDQLQRSNAVATIVQNVWVLIGSNKLPGIADDSLVSQSLRFISTAIRTGYYKDLFSSKETISTLVQGVVIPNVSLREHDVEQFEDDPLEFIRLDLSLSGGAGSDLATRRHAAADVLQALVASGLEADTTEIVGSWINTGLAQYNSDKAENWKAKDSAIFLLTAIATRGSTSQVCVLFWDLRLEGADGLCSMV